MPDKTRDSGLRDRLAYGLDAPICLTWELTYACNLACVHCLSSSGRRDPRELSNAEAMAVVDELVAMKVFYVNIGGGEPMLRADFFDLIGYAVDHRVGVKFSTNGTRLNRSSVSTALGQRSTRRSLRRSGAPMSAPWPAWPPPR